MPASVTAGSLGQLPRPARYRSLQTLLLLVVLGSLISSIWLLPTRLERIVAATERGDDAVIGRELDGSTREASKPGETRALVDVALTRGDPAAAAAILQQTLAHQPGSLAAMRLLLEVERQRHRMSEVAALDERIYAITGEASALREAADIYGSLRRTPERVEALRRLNAIGHATASDIAELAHRLADAGAGRDALGLTIGWLEQRTEPLPSEVVSLAAGLSVGEADAAAFARRIGAAIGRSDELGPLYTLTQTYAERGHPELSLIAGGSLGEQLSTRPEVALLLAQLEALQGDFASARRRLLAIDGMGKLLPAALPLLADLDLQAGELEHAAALVGSMRSDQMTEGLPRHLVETVFARGRVELLRSMGVEAIATVSPASGAVVALARGDRKQAEALALAALAPGADLADLGPAFGWALRTLNLQNKALTPLLEAARAGELTEDQLALLLDVASASPGASRALVAVLRVQREKSARAAAAWATVAIRQGSAAEVAQWLKTDGTRLSTGALLNLMLVANERRDPGLARLTGDLLAKRTDLPDGWTPAEVSFASAAALPLSGARLREGLRLIGAPGLTDAARDRVVASITGARGYLPVTAALEPSTEGTQAVEWLAQGVGKGVRTDVLAARLSLLTSIAPRRAAEPLAQIWSSDPERLLSLYITALMRSGGTLEAEATLNAGLHTVAADRQDALLYDIIARLPKAASLPILRVGARTGRADWIAALQEGLLQSGLLDELRADLRTRAAAPGLSLSQRQAIASRLVELDDRVGAIAILAGMPAGMKPSDPAVQQLVYLWGPRASTDAIDWLRNRAMAAPMTDLPLWLEQIAYVGSPRTVIDLVERQPRVLGAGASAARLYGAALIATRQKPEIDLSSALATLKTHDELLAVAQLALDTGQNLIAWRAATDAVRKAPSDRPALLLAAQTAASIHRSSEAAELYTRLLALGPQTRDILVDAGDAMLAAKQAESGRAVLQTALAQLPTDPGSLAEARLRARVLLLLRRTNEAKTLLSFWLTKFPDHSGLKADLLQIEMTGERSAL